MKINETPVLAMPVDDHERMVHQALLDWMRRTAVKVNALAGGSMSAKDGTATSAPTTGTWAQGDRVENADPVEVGASGAKYVVHGWVCTVGGTPGTWVQQRMPTGN